MKPGPDPLLSFPGMDGKFFLEDPSGEVFVQQNSSASDHPARLRQSSMPPDETGSRDAVTIHQEQVLAA